MAYEDDWDSAVGFSADDIDPDEAEKGGGFVDKPGKYHLEINLVKFDGGGKIKDDGEPATPCLTLQMTVLHSVKGQSPAGARLFHRVYFSDKENSHKLITKLGLRLGLLVKRDGKAIDPASGTTRIVPSLFKRAEGLQCIAEVRMEEYKGKEQAKIPFNDVWGVTHPDVADVPKSGEHLALIGVAAKSASQQAPKQSPVAAAAPSLGNDEFADL